MERPGGFESMIVTCCG